MGESLTVLDLFSGIGTISIGLEAAGFVTGAFCEADASARAVLHKHWPDTPIHEDVRTLHIEPGEFDLLCGGFPCQDISQAGRRVGLSGKRSGLWFEFERLIGEGRPKAVLIENVTALRRRGLGTILRALLALRYDAEWHCIPGSYVGSPDIRDRLWVIAYPQHSDADRIGSHQAQIDLFGASELLDEQERVAGSLVPALSRNLARVGPGGGRGWRPEPGVRRVVDGSPDVVHRLRLLGNATKHRIPEAIGRALIERIAA